MPIVTETGFAADPLKNAEFLSLSALESGGGLGAYVLTLDNDVDMASVRPYFASCAAISVAFPSFADGRGFSIARRLRANGYEGRLRANGHVIADQLPMAFACGFDEVEISEDLAERQPEEHWLQTIAPDTQTPRHALAVRQSVHFAQAAE